MFKFFIVPLTVAFIIFTGVYKINHLKLNVPKSLVILIDALFKLLISSIFAKNYLIFDKKILICNFCFTISNWMYYKTTEKLDIFLLTALAPMKIIFIYLLLKFIEKKKYSIREYFGLFLIFIGFLLTNFFKEKNKIKIENHYLYIFHSIFGNFCGAFGLIYFNKKIRKKNIYFWNYIFTYNLQNIFVSFIQLFFEYCFSKNYNSIFYLKNKKFYLNSIIRVSETFASTFLSFQLSALKKMYSFVIIVISVSILYNLLNEDSINKGYLFAGFLAYLGLFICESKNLKSKKV